MSNLESLKARIVKAAPKFARIVRPAYFANKHYVLTKRGLAIPTEEEIEYIICELVERLENGVEASSTAGIQIELDLDENGEPIDGSIGYVTTIASLLGEEE